VLGRIGISIIPVLATDNLVSLPSVPMSVVQSVSPISSVLMMVTYVPVTGLGLVQLFYR